MYDKTQYTVYILECADQTLYIGITNDMEKRLYAHNHLKTGAKYTRVRRPVVLRFKEEFATRSEALKREHQLKLLPRREKLVLLEHKVMS